jgi:RecG-like helicase
MTGKYGIVETVLRPTPVDIVSSQISWFLIPGVVLAKQQYEVLSEALPPVSMQFLTGARGVDKWSNQEIWDTIMESRVIISTHQVCSIPRLLPP